MESVKSGLICLRHPKYDGVSSPDLTCKICCAKFVDRIRSEQNASFTATWQARPQPASLENIASNRKNGSFEPLSLSKDSNNSVKRQTNFDGFYI